jgi:hypothetical protein
MKEEKEKKEKKVMLRLEQSLLDQIIKSAIENDRKTPDQIRFLIKKGLEKGKVDDVKRQNFKTTR